MTAKQYTRGHEIYYDENKQEWLYSDDHTSASIERPCKRCGYLPFANGVDYCLGIISDCKGITNACCGHGKDEDAYILLEDGRRFILDKNGDV